MLLTFCGIIWMMPFSSKLLRSENVSYKKAEIQKKNVRVLFEQVHMA